MKKVSQHSRQKTHSGISLSLRDICRRMPARGDGKVNGISTDSGTSVRKNHDFEIVTDVNMKVAKGETCAVVGASGSGKTTLLGIMAGMDSPDNGQVILRAEDQDALSLYDCNEEQRARVRARDMGFVFQNFQLVDDMHALDNVLLSLQLSCHARGEKPVTAEIKATASEWLTKVGLGDRQFHFPRQLSGGEQQRVALARAFACQPGILFADEPTGSLDENTAEEMMSLLFSLNRDTGSTMILVTHDSSLASRCDSIYRLERHRLRHEKASDASPSVQPTCVQA